MVDRTFFGSSPFMYRENLGLYLGSGDTFRYPEKLVVDGVADNNPCCDEFEYLDKVGLGSNSPLSSTFPLGGQLS